VTASPSPFDAVLQEIAELEARAAGIQGDDRVLADEQELTAFVDVYLRWYARALELLPSEFQQAFRFEYTGDLFRHRIKHFLESPGEESPFFNATENPLNLSRWNHPYDREFRAPLLQQRQILLEAKQQLEGEGGYRLHLDLIERIARGLPELLEPLKNRHAGRPAFVIEDEYDLQDLLHGLLRLFYDDVRAEDYAPDRAGSRSRIDFVLKTERVVVETKMTRRDLGARQVGEQLIVDIERYRSHPDCAALLAVIYDPDKRITNRRGLEADLSGNRDGLVVRVLVVQ
jgi:hypothetical protein